MIVSLGSSYDTHFYENSHGWPKLGAAPPVPTMMVDGGDSNDEHPLQSTAYAGRAVAGENWRLARILRLQIITPPPQKKDMAYCTSITDSKRDEDKAKRMRVRNNI
jgi:hypothetical protein